MPHITNMDERCVIFVSQHLIGYNKAVEFNSQTTPLNLHQRDVFEFGLSKRDEFINMNVIIALRSAFRLATEFFICV